MNKQIQTVVIFNKLQHSCLHLDFMEILLDETLVFGTVYIPDSCMEKVSFLNRRLPAKQNYEFLLRLSLEYPVCVSNQLPGDQDSYVALELQESELHENGLQTDCYLIARYKDALLSRNLFDSAITSVLSAAEQIGCRQQMLSFLELMLQGKSTYQYYFQGSQPFLIYTGDPACFHILSVFAESLGTALRGMGYQVEYFDLSKEDYTSAAKYIGQSFQAVIGMQTYMFSACLTNDSFLHDSIYGPKYNFVFDHPVRFQKYLMKTPQNMTIFSFDQDYVTFSRQNYPVNVRFMPPGGIIKPFDSRELWYDVTFIGSYGDNADAVSAQLQILDRPMRFLVNRYWMNMRKNLTSEQALLQALHDYGISLSGEEFTDLLYKFQKFTVYMAFRYRTKLIQTLITNGIKVDVFGLTWKNCPLRDNPNLIWHETDLTTDECLHVWQHSKFSLNMMSWHKNAFTERIANSMLQKAVVITDRNPYLESQFRDGQDIIYYDLEQMEKLPERIHRLLQSPKRISEIGENGYQKAAQYHTWDCRAKELIQIAAQDAAAIRDSENSCITKIEKD